MALLNQQTQVWAQLPTVFEAIRQGQAPEKINREFLRDLGFKSSNHFAIIPLFKGLGLISADGTPTDRYRSLLDKTKWRKTIAEAVKEAYGDIFILRATPTKSDLDTIIGKYKSTYNLTDVSAERAAKTFLALLDLADQDALNGNANTATPPLQLTTIIPEDTSKEGEHRKRPPAGLHYNIQIHLPATKDLEVYNAIFKSLRSHLLD
jgi:hypothetical protein